MPVRTHTPTLGALAALALLSACGGGGGEVAPAPPPASPQISAENMTSAATSALMLVDSAATLPDTGLRVSPASASARPMAVASEKDAPPALAQQYTDGGACLGGGSWSTVADDKNNNAVEDQGDTLAVTYRACAGQGFALNGSVLIVLSALSGDWSNGNGTAAMSIDYLGYSVNDDNGTSTLTGRATYSAALNSPGTSTFSLGMNGMRVAYTAAGTSTDSFSAELVAASVAVDDDGQVVTLRLSETARITSKGFSGTVVISTPQPVKAPRATLGAGVPASGQIKVEAGKSTLLITYLGGDNARLELDSDGDGTRELARDVKLSELSTL